MTYRIQPNADGFAELGRDHRVVTVWTRLMADDLTPVGLYAKLANRPGTFLLESAEHGHFARWSFVGINSAATLTESEGEAIWRGNAPSGLPTGGNPLAVLAQTLRSLNSGQREELPPFSSGLVGYVGYDAVRRIEALPDSCHDDLLLPELVMMLTTDMAAFDHQNGEVWLMANAINFDDTDERLEQAYADAVDRVDQMVGQVLRPAPSLALAPAPERSSEQLVAELDLTCQLSTESYATAVEAAVEEIKAGEAFQIVVSQRFDVSTQASAFDIYRVLRLTNPSPYLYLLRLDGFDIVGSSPEALVTVTDGKALTHPIAGTKPRGKTPALDVELERELLADEKERAEHLMLVDLGRNDLGRVCKPGTVSVVEFMIVRRYSHVMHLESSVVGELSDGVDAVDAVMACFPAGTLSGAPKVRAMEIIDKLEVSRRGLYGGIVGYFDFDGNADAAIAIRTAVLRGGTAHVQAGGGIVADSQASYEDAESRNKAAAVLSAIARAERLAPIARPASRP